MSDLQAGTWFLVYLTTYGPLNYNGGILANRIFSTNHVKMSGLALGEIIYLHLIKVFIFEKEIIVFGEPSILVMPTYTIPI